MTRLTFAKAKRRKGPLYYTRSCGERCEVESWRNWGKDTLLVMKDGREFVVSRHGAFLETESRR